MDNKFSDEKHKKLRKTKYIHMQKQLPTNKKTTVSNKSAVLKFASFPDAQDGPKLVAEKLKISVSNSFNSDPKRETKAQFIDRINQMYNTQVCITLKAEEINRLDDEMICNAKSLRRKVERHQRDIAKSNQLLVDSEERLLSIRRLIEESQLSWDDIEAKISDAQDLLNMKKESLAFLVQETEALAPSVALFKSLHACHYREGVSAILNALRGTDPVICLEEPVPAEFE